MWSLNDAGCQVARAGSVYFVAVQLTTPAPSVVVAELVQEAAGPLQEELAAQAQTAPEVARYLQLARQLQEAEQRRTVAAATLRRINAQREEALLRAAPGLGATLAQLDRELAGLSRQQAAAASEVQALQGPVSEARTKAGRQVEYLRRDLNKALLDQTLKRRSQAFIALTAAVQDHLDELAVCADILFAAAHSWHGAAPETLLDSLLRSAQDPPPPPAPEPALPAAAADVQPEDVQAVEPEPTLEPVGAVAGADEPPPAEYTPAPWRRER